MDPSEELSTSNKPVNFSRSVNYYLPGKSSPIDEIPTNLVDEFERDGKCVNVKAFDAYVAVRRHFHGRKSEYLASRKRVFKGTFTNPNIGFNQETFKMANLNFLFYITGANLRYCDDGQCPFLPPNIHGIIPEAEVNTLSVNEESWKKYFKFIFPGGCHRNVIGSPNISVLAKARFDIIAMKNDADMKDVTVAIKDAIKYSEHLKPGGAMVMRIYDTYRDDVSSLIDLVSRFDKVFLVKPYTTFYDDEKYLILLGRSDEANLDEKSFKIWLRHINDEILSFLLRKNKEVLEDMEGLGEKVYHNNCRLVNLWSAY